MTKKHFNAMAAKFKALLETADRTAPENVRAGIVLSVYAFCDLAADINPRFDRDRFTEACGL